MFGAEGRGAYAGASAYGLHAEVSQNGGFTGGWEIHVVDSLMHKDTVLYGGDTIRVVDGSLPYVFVVSPDSDTVVVDFYVRPDTKSLFKSSSSVNLGSSSSTGWNYSYSIDDGDDFVYQSALSSSSWVDGESSCLIPMINGGWRAIPF